MTFEQFKAKKQGCNTWKKRGRSVLRANAQWQLGASRSNLC
jgi:hypothetical protein